MCMPLGPKTSCCYGRRTYNTIGDIFNSCDLETAMNHYPDNAEAMKKIFEYTDENIEHTINWMVDDLQDINIYLARIAVEEENLAAWKKYYNKAKRIYSMKQNNK